MIDKKIGIFLSDRKYKKVTEDYFSYLDLGWKSFSRTDIPVEIKLKKIDFLDKAIRKDCPLKNNIIYRLQKELVKENISTYLLLDPLIAWRYLALNKVPTSEKQVSDIVNYAISPLARFMMVLYDENPSTYMPMNALLCLFYYIQMFNENSPILKKAKFYKRQRDSKLKGLVKSAKVILQLVKSKKLKFRLAFILNKGIFLTDKFLKNKQVKLGVLDYLMIFMYSMWQFMVIRKRTITKEGI